MSVVERENGRDDEKGDTAGSERGPDGGMKEGEFERRA